MFIYSNLFPVQVSSLNPKNYFKLCPDTGLPWRLLRRRAVQFSTFFPASHVVVLPNNYPHFSCYCTATTRWWCVRVANCSYSALWTIPCWYALLCYASNDVCRIWRL